MNVLVANSKGGVGKSTISMMLANFLADAKKKVQVIELDAQSTNLTQRNYDLSKNPNKDVKWEIRRKSLDDPDLKSYLHAAQKDKTMISIIDVPGDLENQNMIYPMQTANIIIIPFNYERKILKGTSIFINVLTGVLKEQGNTEAQILFVPNRVNTSKLSKDDIKLKQMIEDVMSKFGVVTPRIKDIKAITEVGTLTLPAVVKDAVNMTFDFILKRIEDVY